ncbi:hypothetical protein FRC07_005535 [Ceratobasidium sp. 392]|nr:hypothetical protein FRC07_005535 [Ceratobasidium sp. 392]
MEYDNNERRHTTLGLGRPSNEKYPVAGERNLVNSPERKPFWKSTKGIIVLGIVAIFVIVIIAVIGGVIGGTIVKKTSGTGTVTVTQSSPLCQGGCGTIRSTSTITRPSNTVPPAPSSGDSPPVPTQVPGK